MRSRVIVVDDHPGMLEQMVSMLQKDFDVVATAQNGLAALDAVRRFDPEIIVLDIAMSPVNGLEVARRLRDSGARTSIILVSGYREEEIKREALASGVEAFVSKSRLHDDLLSAVRNAGRRLAKPV